MAPLSKIAKLLRDGRVQSGLTQGEVARKLGYQTAQFVSNWERGMTTPPGKTLRKLVDLYDLSHAIVYEALLEYAIERAKQTVREDYYGKVKGRH